MKKCMNRAEDFEEDSIKGILAAYPTLYKTASRDIRAFCRAETVPGKVSIVTGGGYGHLPVFAGYVGEGLCDGAAIGNVFTSPSYETIMNVTREVHGGAGVLYLFANYFGDGMNFELASEMAETEGLAVATVKVSDDIASAPRERRTERRGIAGLFFCCKLAGASAGTMASLDEVARVARKAAAGTATFGAAFSSCALPAVGRPIFTLDENEMELGMGIHGEPGIRREPLATSAELADTVCASLGEDLGIVRGDRIAVLVNGLGATSREELYILYNDVRRYWDSLGVAVEKAYVGEYATSLEMAGVSVSVLKLDEEMIELLHAPAHTPFAVC